MGKIKLGIVGVGKIARDQHLPVIAASPDFELVAAASRNAAVEGVANFTSLSDMIAAHPEIEAVSLCTPPAVRAPDARFALDSGHHVLLEKPPASTLSDVESLVATARERSVALHASWHSRHAPAVAPARAWLADKRITSVQIIWKEDIRIWHPGQDWILEAGGPGVFDPGINALSIATRILPRPFALTSATLSFPENRDAPIAAQLAFRDDAGVAINADFDFLQTGPQTWDIRIATDAGPLLLSHGGAKLHIEGVEQTLPADSEYEGVYAAFAELVRAGRIDVDPAPLRHVADAFMLGRRRIVEPFHY